MQQRRRTSEAPSPSPRPLLLPFTAGKRVKREALSTTSSRMCIGRMQCDLESGVRASPRLPPAPAALARFRPARPPRAARAR